jgi:hypothetical protein
MHTHAVHADDMHSVFFKQINSAITTAAIGPTPVFLRLIAACQFSY